MRSCEKLMEIYVLQGFPGWEPKFPFGGWWFGDDSIGCTERTVTNVANMTWHSEEQQLESKRFEAKLLPLFQSRSHAGCRLLDPNPLPRNATLTTQVWRMLWFELVLCRKCNDEIPSKSCIATWVQASRRLLDMKGDPRHPHLETMGFHPSLPDLMI